MKKITISIVTLFVLFTVNCFAQDNEAAAAHFGIKAGLNVANVTAKANGVSASASSLIGLTGGFFATIPGGSGFAVQPELLYSQLGTKSGSDKATFGYIVVPVLAKYTFESTGFGAYIGPQIGFLLSAKDKSGGVSTDTKSEYKSTDVAGVVGVEYTLPVGVVLSARYQLGFTNIIKDASDGVSLKHNALTLTVGFKFK